MDDNARLQLQKMIATNDVKDQTENIRRLKHSSLLRTDIDNMILLKAKYRHDAEEFKLEAMNECNFLFTYYTDIFNKIRKDELDFNILGRFIDILKQIEDGNLDQHEGAFAVGTLLKELYVDSAIKKGEKLDKEYENKDKEPPRETMEISWKQFKNMK